MEGCWNIGMNENHELDTHGDEARLLVGRETI